MAFALAGIPGGAAANAAEARELLAQGRADPGVGLVLITERVAREIRPEVDAVRREGRPPLILEIPDLKGPLPGGQSLLERLRTSWGYRSERASAHAGAPAMSGFLMIRTIDLDMKAGTDSRTLELKSPFEKGGFRGISKWL